MKFSITAVACLGSVFLSGYCLPVQATGYRATQPTHKGMSEEGEKDAPITRSDALLIVKFIEIYFGKDTYVSFESDVSGAAMSDDDNTVFKAHHRFIGNPRSKFHLDSENIISTSGDETSKKLVLSTVSDGKQVWQYDQAQKQYTSEKSSTENNGKIMAEAFSFFGFFGVGGEFFEKASKKVQGKNDKFDNKELVLTARDKKVDGVSYRVISARDDDSVMQFTIEQVSASLRAFHMMTNSEKSITTYTEVFRSFSLVKQADPKTFTFTPPTEATKVAEL